MYDKKIYDEWKIHADATQHEIIFKYLEKTIKVLDTKKLTDAEGNLITDTNDLKRWKVMTANEILDQYNLIATHPFEVAHDENPLMDILSCVAQAIVILRKNNIKVNDLEQVYEPKIFRITTSLLSIRELKVFYTILLQDIFSNISEIDENIKFTLKVEETTNIRNTVWNLENMCLAFTEVVKWFNTTDCNLDEKKYLLNLMLIFNITNFYLRYIYDLNGGIIKYNRIYDTTTSYIAKTIDEGRPFVLIVFKSIAIFLNELVKKYNFEKNDTIITNYLSIINIYCNESNIEKLKNIIFSELGSL